MASQVAPPASSSRQPRSTPPGESPTVALPPQKGGTKGPAKSVSTKRPRDMRANARRKTTRLEARITAAQKALLQQAAELRGQTLTEFVVRAGEEEATRVLERAGVLVLSTRESAAFVEALLDPPAPNARLLAAAERYDARRGGENSRKQEPRQQPRVAHE